MNRARTRPILIASLALALVWIAALAGSAWFRNATVTAETVAGYLNSTSLDQLAGQARRDALNRLTELMNALSIEERRKARLDGAWRAWFESMTDQEKSDFLEATMPSGFRQMLASFEQLPEERRRQSVENALREMQRTRDAMEADPNAPKSWRSGPEDQNELSPELREKAIQIGLSTFYNESSAQTKAELAPVLEEMQRLMERGVPFRPGRRRSPSP